jgi:hypothetical protein
MNTRRAIGTLTVLLVAVAAALLVGCGSGSEELGFSGDWVSTGGSEFSLTVGAATDGEYPVTFVGGDIERTLTATQENDTTYRGEGETDVWVFRMVDDDLMDVTVTAADGESATTGFKRR